MGVVDDITDDVKSGFLKITIASGKGAIMSPLPPDPSSTSWRVRETLMMRGWAGREVVREMVML